MFNFFWLNIDSSWQTSDSKWLDRFCDSTRPSHDSILTRLEKNSDDSDSKGLWLDSCLDKYDSSTSLVDCWEFRLLCSHVQRFQAFYRCNTYVGHKNVRGVHVGHLGAVLFVEPVGLRQWFPTFFITFLPLLILELLIPPLLHKLFFHSSPITRVYENLIHGYILSRLPFTCHGELIFELGRLYGLQMKNGLYWRQ